MGVLRRKNGQLNLPLIMLLATLAVGLVAIVVNASGVFAAKPKGPGGFVFVPPLGDPPRTRIEPEITVVRPEVKPGESARIQLRTLPGAKVKTELTWPSGKKLQSEGEANNEGMADAIWPPPRDAGQGRATVLVIIEKDGRTATGNATFNLR